MDTTMSCARSACFVRRARKSFVRGAGAICRQNSKSPKMAKYTNLILSIARKKILFTLSKNCISLHYCFPPLFLAMSTTTPMDEHAATNDVAEKAHNCPYFQQHGCPFAKQETFDVNALKQHPAFAQGCPYKNVDAHKLKDCPAFQNHKCPFDGTQKIDLSKVHECPAFKVLYIPFAGAT